MSISEVAIHRPVFAWMLMISLMLFGWLSYKRMGVSQLPDVDFPVVTINVSLDGASPEVMEMEVIEPLESAVMGVQGILGVNATAKSGSASISVEFDIDKDIDLAVQDIQNVVAKAVRRLPKDIEYPSVSKSNPEDRPILWLTVTSKSMPRKEIMDFVRNRVQDRFTTIEGVGEVMVGGYVEPTLRVWVSSQKLQQNYLSVTDIISAINSEHVEKPAGRIEGERQEYNIRMLGEAIDMKEFSKLAINKRASGVNYNPLTLAEVATVEDGLADVRQMSRVVGVPAIGLGIKKQRGYNSVEVANSVKERMEEIRKSLPSGVEIAVRFDSTKFIKEAIHELNFTLVFSALLTALVCWLFLGSFTATINVILAIPTSVLGTFIVLNALGFTLNTFTLLGLSLAIGVVVDDAIMVLENIVRHREKGEGRKAAAILGSREITLAAMATTAAIIAIFLPVAYMKGIIGKYFFQFGVTISVAVAISLLEALTLTPMRCSQFLEVAPRSSIIGKLVEGGFHRSQLLYQKIIPTILRFRFTTIAITLVIFAASLLIVTKMKKEFVPAQDQGMLMVRLNTPVGTSLEVTDKRVAEVEEVLAKSKEVSQYFTSIGGSDVSSAMIYVTLIDPPRITQQAVAGKLKEEIKKIKGIKASIQDPSQAGFSTRRGYPVEFSIKGPNWEKIVAYVETMMAKMEESGHFSDLDSNYRSGMPEVQVIPDRERAREYAVNIGEIVSTVNAAMGGVVAGQFSRDGHRYDVRVRLVAGERKTPEDIKKIFVKNNRGELIPLHKVVKIQNGEGLQSIHREDRERAISVHANIAPGFSQEEAADEVRAMGKALLSEEYHISMSGNTKAFSDSLKNLSFALLLGIAIAYMFLASQFNSFIHPLTVLTTLPFALTGALIALYITGQSLNIYSMIGVILLMGLVKKNSIMLVDFTNQKRAEGLAVKDALIAACPIRLRPILMTSIATLVGAIPPALSLGPGAESRVPMAITVIGGIIVSTLLTLFVVPCVYSLLAKFERNEKVP
ncbi:MAG: efflux RND transporter permease subunit [Oligoflexia bacterium]|nr:efflux RND transporter permease subunit [Oligoflexia bacterium]MBF0364291.1 efflux RND transporter permease subunit [Oligoflexia bacterium]